ncbi:MAG: ferredoxin [Nanoarchaeota archaeon]|nr:ferredoxin [Nanoarchaeota archaeon]
MRVDLNKEECIGCGACVSLCPKVFVMKGAKAVVKEKETEESCAKEAADSCPVNAIRII